MTAKKCTKKRDVVFFLSKPIAFLTFSLASPSSLLKLPLKFLTMPDSEDELCTSCLLRSGYFRFTMLTSDFVPTERHSIYTRAVMALDLKRGLKV